MGRQSVIIQGARSFSAVQQVNFLTSGLSLMNPHASTRLAEHTLLGTVVADHARCWPCADSTVYIHKIAAIVLHAKHSAGAPMRLANRSGVEIRYAARLSPAWRRWLVFVRNVIELSRKVSVARNQRRDAQTDCQATYSNKNSKNDHSRQETAATQRPAF